MNAKHLALRLANSKRSLEMLVLLCSPCPKATLKEERPHSPPLSYTPSRDCLVGGMDPNHSYNW